jgi:hypothetical protein
MIRICDICKKSVTDKQVQKMVVIDNKGYHDAGLLGIIPGAKRKWSIDICDDCLDSFKAFRQEKVLTPIKEFEKKKE